MQQQKIEESLSPFLYTSTLIITRDSNRMVLPAKSYAASISERKDVDTSLSSYSFISYTAAQRLLSIATTLKQPNVRPTVNRVATASQCTVELKDCEAQTAAVNKDENNREQAEAPSLGSSLKRDADAKPNESTTHKSSDDAQPLIIVFCSDFAHLSGLNKCLTLMGNDITRNSQGPMSSTSFNQHSPPTYVNMRDCFSRMHSSSLATPSHSSSTSSTKATAPRTDEKYDLNNNAVVHDQSIEKSNQLNGAKSFMRGVVAQHSHVKNKQNACIDVYIQKK